MAETTDHVYLDLSNEEEPGPHSPRLAVYLELPDEQERADGDTAKVVLHLGMLMGQQMRWAEMDLEQANALAKMLIDATERAIEVEQEHAT